MYRGEKSDVGPTDPSHSSLKGTMRRASLYLHLESISKDLGDRTRDEPCSGGKKKEHVIQAEDSLCP